MMFTYVPIMASDGRSVQGLFCPCTETTEKGRGARRLETLRRLGVQVLETRAVDAACEEAANVIIPNLGGGRLLREIWNDARLAGVPVRLLPARAGEVAAAEVARAGTDDYLIKPFKTGELLVRIDSRGRRGRAEDSLCQSEERFRRYFELGMIGMAVTSPNKGLIEVNEKICEILGYERSELLQMTWTELTYPDDLAADVTQFNRVMIGELDGYSMDKRWVRKDGRVIYATISVKCLRRADGSVDCFVALLQDVTERKQAEETLRRAHDELEQRVLERTSQLSAVNGELAREIAERRQAEEELCRSEAYLAEAQRLSHTGSWWWNVVTGEVIWSQEHFRICGLDPGRVKPSYEMFFQLVHPQDRLFLKEAFERSVCERGDFEGLYRIVRPDGRLRHIHGQAHPGFDQQGALTEYVGTIIDITERKLAEESLRQAQAELAHVSRVTSLGELTASIAHEVNQPLGAIVTNGQSCLRLLLKDPANLAQMREAIESMISDALRASEVIKRIRGFLKKNAVERGPLRINGVIQEVIALTAGELARHQVLLRTELAENLPMILGDHVQLQQVLLNLILNAKDAMSGECWHRRELLISSRKTKRDEVLVEVRDSGIGLDPQTAEHIFDAFFTTRQEDGGLGLGLSISRTIIESHGGRLWATSNEGKGTTFQFTLPINGGIEP
ncbi:MAG TPA: PAS domain S-box protein [Blastocatellia bacterium]|nr:PAS domain S-box protein [Blastocatellia bacterium]